MVSELVSVLGRAADKAAFLKQREERTRNSGERRVAPDKRRIGSGSNRPVPAATKKEVHPGQVIPMDEKDFQDF
jgi:hypothetical protein